MSQSSKVVFVNGKSRCGCRLEYSDGKGLYSDVTTIELCSKHLHLETETNVVQFKQKEAPHIPNDGFPFNKDI